MEEAALCSCFYSCTFHLSGAGGYVPYSHCEGKVASLRLTVLPLLRFFI